METSTSLGSRRNAAQMHALACVQREVRANDSSGRRKYLRDHNNAFLSYESVIDSQESMTTVKAADLILIGDYLTHCFSGRNVSPLPCWSSGRNRAIVLWRLDLNNFFAASAHSRRMVREVHAKRRIPTAHSLQSPLGLRVGSVLRIAGERARTRRRGLCFGLHAKGRLAQDWSARSARC